MSNLFDVTRLSKPWFLGLQAVLICSAIGGIGSRVRERSAETALPPLREAPWDIGPLYDYDFIITDEQLSRTLRKLRPQFEGKDTKIYHTDHHLRAWTAAAVFDEPQYMSGQGMVRLLTDHRAFAEVYGEELAEKKPLLIDGGPGVRVREQEGPTTSSHHDHTLACLAEIGMPLSHPIVTPNRTTTFRAMLEQSLRDFSLNQIEYEWSALAYVLFLPPTNRWVTTEGQEVSFDKLAERIMRESLPRGVCAANHRFHALVMFLRVDDLMQSMGEQPLLSPETRGEVIDYLHNVVATLVKNQHPDGFWNRNYMDGPPASSAPTELEGDKLDDRIIATGHVLEWLALAPAELHPPRSTLVSAGQWLVRTVDGLTPAQTRQFASFLSHAGRALALWRGRTPAEVNLNLAEPAKPPSAAVEQPSPEAEAGSAAPAESETAPSSAASSASATETEAPAADALLKTPASDAAEVSSTQDAPQQDTAQEVSPAVAPREAPVKAPRVPENEPAAEEPTPGASPDAAQEASPAVAPRVAPVKAPRVADEEEAAEEAGPRE